MPDRHVQTVTPAIRVLHPAPVKGKESFVSTYLVLGVKKALVDIGPKVSAPGVVSALAEAGLKPTDVDYIILTHIHIDHGGGTGTVLKAMTNAQVVAHPRGRSHLIEPSKLWLASLQTLGDTARMYQEIEPVPADRIVDANDGMKLDLGEGTVLELYMTPGHSAHHLSVFDPRHRVMLAGDAAGIFSNGWLRLTTPPPFRLDEYLASLDRMIALRPRLLGYAHLGCYPDAVERLEATKAKVRLWYRIAQAGAKAGKKPEEVARDIRREDRELGVMDRMQPDELKGHYSFFLTSIQGLMTAPAPQDPNTRKQ